MTEPTPRRRRVPAVSARFLAVAVLLAGMAYVTYDTQRQVHAANDQRATLQKRVNALDATVKALTAENKRLTGLLLNAGIDPRPRPTTIPSPSASRARTVPVQPRPRTTTPRPAPAPAASPTAPSPTPRASHTPSPRPTPTSTCRIRSPLDGRCLVV